MIWNEALASFPLLFYRMSSPYSLCFVLLPVCVSHLGSVIVCHICMVVFINSVFTLLCSVPNPCLCLFLLYLSLAFVDYLPLHFFFCLLAPYYNIFECSVWNWSTLTPLPHIEKAHILSWIPELSFSKLRCHLPQPLWTIRWLTLIFYNLTDIQPQMWTFV